MYTQTNSPLNIASIIREIKSINLNSKNNSPKVFPYVENYTSRNKSNSPEHVISRNNLSKILFNLHNKIKKSEDSHFHFVTLKYHNAKFLNNEFISKVKQELEENCENKYVKKPKHLRSLSQNKAKKLNNIRKISVKRDLRDLAILPAPNFPKSVRNYKCRKDSLPEHNIDFKKLDLPYFNLKKENYEWDEIETKDFSMNT